MSDSKSMKHLKPEKIRKTAEPLKEMIRLQRDFVQRFDIHDNLPMARTEQITKEFVLCIMDECSEVLGHINWKHWKKTRKTVDMREVKFEIIDLLHFVLNLAILWGMDADDIWKYFKVKNNENINRQKKGY